MPSIRESLEAARSAMNGEAPPPEATSDAPETSAAPVGESNAPTLATSGPPEAAQTPSPTPGRAPNGRFQRSAASSTAPQSPPEAPGRPQDAKTTPEPGEGTPPKPQAWQKAPQNWKPEARELHAALPDLVKQEIQRREQEFARGTRDYGELRKANDTWNAIFAPYEHIMRAEGLSPQRAAYQLAQTYAALRVGAPALKAQIIAGVVKQHAIPIELLAEALDGAPQAGGRGPAAQPAYTPDPRVDHLIGYLQGQEQRQHQAMANHAVTTVETFLESKPYGSDVREQMGHILDVYAQQEKLISLDEAYEMACMMNEDIRKLMEHEKGRAAAQQNQGVVNRNRAAASSLRTSPAAPVAQPPGELTLRDQLRANLRAQQQREQ